MANTVRILIDGTFHLRCDVDHVDRIVNKLELQGMCFADMVWSDDALGRTTVSLTTVSDDDEE